MDLKDIFGSLPRQGPGSSASTLRALSLMTELPLQLRIADMGCGTGAHTRLLARATGGHVTAVDRHRPFLDALQEQAARQGLSGCIDIVEADIGRPELEEGAFDIVWSEGAAYAVGFENALSTWIPLLSDGGYLAVSECSWLTDAPSDACRSYWADLYPAMQTVEANRELIRGQGLTIVHDFALPSEAWWAEYYTPLEAELQKLEASGDEEVEALRLEMEMFRKHDHEYGYVFYVARRGPGAELQSPPRTSWLGRLRNRPS